MPGLVLATAPHQGRCGPLSGGAQRRARGELDQLVVGGREGVPEEGVDGALAAEGEHQPVGEPVARQPIPLPPRRGGRGGPRHGRGAGSDGRAVRGRGTGSGGRAVRGRGGRCGDARGGRLGRCGRGRWGGAAWCRRRGRCGRRACCRAAPCSRRAGRLGRRGRGRWCGDARGGRRVWCGWGRWGGAAWCRRRGRCGRRACCRAAPCSRRAGRLGRCGRGRRGRCAGCRRCGGAAGAAGVLAARWAAPAASPCGLPSPGTRRRVPIRRADALAHPSRPVLSGPVVYRAVAFVGESSTGGFSGSATRLARGRGRRRGSPIRGIRRIVGPGHRLERGAIPSSYGPVGTCPPKGDHRPFGEGSGAGRGESYAGGPIGL